MVTSLTGCFASYPTASDVATAAKNIPPMETIADGRSYLAAARDAMVTERNRVQMIDYGLDVGIVGGAVTTALGTALKWSSHGNITAGILTAAVIGVSSTLSLKTQQAIINRGLDALVCVESQAEAAYVPVRERDVVLAPVVSDIANLNTKLSQVEINNPSSNVAGLARVDLLTAQNWLSLQSVPIANVVVSAKIAVDTVLQTTVDQLNAYLPDGSAFSKISLSPQPASKSPPPVNPPAPQLTPRHVQEIQGREAGAPTTSPEDATALQNYVATLQNDMKAANAILLNIPPPNPVAQLPTINCPVTIAAPTQALQISPSSITISVSNNVPASLSVIGGTPPYKKAEITTAASATGLTPLEIQANISGSTVTLTHSTKLKTGTYNLVLTDAADAQRTGTVIVKA
jgi:hypothetical protein